MRGSGVLMGSMMLVALVGLLLGAGTVTYFSDTETSGGNSFAAGTLDLKVDGNDNPISAYFSVSNVEPGDSDEVVISLSNAGSLDGNAKIHVKNVVNNPGETPEPEPTADNGELGANLLITILYDVNGDGDYDDDGETIVSDTPLDDLDCTSYDLGPLPAGASRNLKISWSIPSDTGNEIMGDIVGFEIEFSLEQA